MNKKIRRDKELILDLITGPDAQGSGQRKATAGTQGRTHE